MSTFEFTKKQNECIEFDPNHDLLVQGIAGSGKSLVLVYRALGTAIRAKENGERPTIAILTFANSLKNYTQEVVEQYRANDITQNITVDTIDSQIRRLYSHIMLEGKFFKLQYDNDSLFDEIIAKEMQKKKNRFLGKNMHEFLWDEIRWIKQRSNKIKSLDDYSKAERHGRGNAIRPTQKDRAVIWSVYDQYYKEAKRRRYYDAEAVFAEMADRIDEIPESMKFDYVFVDECQDLGLTKIRIAKGLARKSITLAADLAQMIYHVGFSWAEVGIDIRGQASKKLYGSFRNTKQIMLLAESVKQKNTSLPSERREIEIPDREGPKPQLYFMESDLDEYSRIAEILKKEQREHPDFTIAIIVRSARDMNRMEEALKSKGITYYQRFDAAGFKILTPGIKLITYHSSKGLEFDEVILPFLDEGTFPYLPKDADIDQIDNLMNDSRSLLYVGMTRAKFALFMFSNLDKKSPLINDFDKRYYAIG
ncbi:3'-5' exonuclease [Megasphaera elsdenii]|uniref:3'-5' exonuclease n=1 Tax=Megasphaera elsdenii TaxID=907 RepID=UPI003D088A68